MAASVALPERYRQPAAVQSQTKTINGVAADRSSLMHDSGAGHRCRNGYHRPHHATKYNSVSAGSALSQSMRYADGWLYERNAGGTVGHGGGRGRTRSTFLGREHFGTTAKTTASAAAAAAATAASTMTAATPSTVTTKIASAVPSSEDPYECVRRNRMAGAKTALGGGKPDRKRNRSGSSRTPSPDYDDTGGGGGGGSSRRSILECHVNPYDLLRQQSDDDLDDDRVLEAVNADDYHSPRRMSLKDKFMNRIQDTVFTKSRTSLGGFGSFSSSSSSSTKKTTATTVTPERNGGGVNIAGHTVSINNFSTGIR